MKDKRNFIGYTLLMLFLVLGWLVYAISPVQGAEREAMECTSDLWVDLTPLYEQLAVHAESGNQEMFEVVARGVLAITEGVGKDGGYYEFEGLWLGVITHNNGWYTIAFGDDWTMHPNSSGVYTFGTPNCVIFAPALPASATKIDYEALQFEAKGI